MKNNSEGAVQKAIEIKDAKISFMSLVDRPANQRPFLIAKAEDGKASFLTYGRILKADEDKHYVTGVAYEPMVEDAQGNFMTAEEIEKAEYWFMRNNGNVDLQHNYEKLENACVVESWIAKSDMVIGDETVTEGTWLVTVEVSDANVWDAVEKKEITGFSIGGIGIYGTEDVSLEKASDYIKKEAEDMGKDNEPIINNPTSTAAPESAPLAETGSEHKGIFKKLAESLGFSVIEKGAVADEIARRNKASAFWNAWYAFESTVHVGYWDSYQDRWKETFEADPDKWREAVTDLSNALNALIEEKDIVKAITAASPKALPDAKSIEKAGKKMSKANRDKLLNICKELNDFISEFAEATEEEEIEKSIKNTNNEEEHEVKTEDISKVADAVTANIMKALGLDKVDKSTNPTPEASATPPASEPISKELIGNLVAEEVKKAFTEVETPAPAAPEVPQQSVSLEEVSKMIKEAVEEVKKSKGFPTNLNDSGGEQHIEKQQHYLHGIL